MDSKHRLGLDGLTSLGAVKSIYFTMETTDIGDWGSNTTFYFGLDKITIRPVKEETGITQLSTYNSQLAVYPNPSRDIINIDGVEIDAHIDIYTLQGELIHSTNATRIDISNFDSGIYILKSGSKTTKLIKQ